MGKIHRKRRPERRSTPLMNEVFELENGLEALGLKRHNIAMVLCKRAKIDRTTYQRWRLGETSPSLSNWRKIVHHATKVKEDLSNGKHVLAKRRRRKPKKARR